MFGLNSKDTRAFLLIATLAMLAPILLNPFPTGSALGAAGLTLFKFEIRSERISERGFCCCYAAGLTFC